jgi:hypothetical protein
MSTNTATIWTRVSGGYAAGGCMAIQAFKNRQNCDEKDLFIDKKNVDLFMDTNVDEMMYRVRNVRV